MEGIQKGLAQHWGKALVGLIVLAIIIAYTSISNMDEEAQDLVLEFFQDYLPLCMFVTLACLLFSGFPVAFILGGLAFLGMLAGIWLYYDDLKNRGGQLDKIELVKEVENGDCILMERKLRGYL